MDDSKLDLNKSLLQSCDEVASYASGHGGSLNARGSYTRLILLCDFVLMFTGPLKSMGILWISWKSVLGKQFRLFQRTSTKPYIGGSIAEQLQA